jgi:hypothetical protein
MLIDKQLVSGIAIALTFIAFLPYIWTILRGDTRPHVFSWVIWGSVTFVVFLAQLADRGGVGAWPIGVSGLITIYVAVLAYLKKSDNSITGKDWWFLIIAMMALPAWYLTSDPLWAVVILTVVDLAGFGPTFRKAFNLPHEENLTFFVIITLRNILVIIALEHYSVATILFPAATAVACVVFILMVMLRRKPATHSG